MGIMQRMDNEGAIITVPSATLFITHAEEIENVGGIGVRNGRIGDFLMARNVL